MLNPMNMFALVILIAASAYAWRRYGRPRAGGVRPTGTQLHCSDRATARPAAAEWLRLVEGLTGRAALCIDETMRVVASGPLADAISISPPDRAGGHLVDLLPADAATSVLGIASAARQGRTDARRIEWDGRRASVSALCVGEDMVVLCVEIL